MLKIILPDDTYIVQITGAREWTNSEAVRRELSNFPSNTAIIHGMCHGADLVADIEAKKLGFISVPCPAHWMHDAKDWVAVYGLCPLDCRQLVGKGAGHLRNTYMLDTYRADIVLAFHEDITRSKGTKNMLAQVQARGIPYKLVTR